MHSYKEEFIAFIHDLQEEICSNLESVEGKAAFGADTWTRPGGGGGTTKTLQGGKVLEKAGVNTSIVHGELPREMAKTLNVEQSHFFACGISLVIHPLNPFAPTTHANYRYFELYDDGKNLVDQWFGGGADLTPYYLFEDDAFHFHQVHKTACDTCHPDFYARFKKDCDAYFKNTHRDEGRGIGGIFFDYLRPDETMTAKTYFNFAKSCGKAFVPAYLPILKSRKDNTFTEKHRYWQELRRGRYVEFNLIHDRGTLFGLKTKGRIESILMSLPPTVRWDYNYRPPEGTPEAKLIEVLKAPRDWIND